MVREEPGGTAEAYPAEERHRITIDREQAVISQSLSLSGTCATTSPVATSIAFMTIGDLEPFTFSMAALRAFPSMARCVPFVPAISPAHSAFRADGQWKPATVV